MKRIIKFLSLSFLLFLAVSCGDGSAAIDRAYEEACGAEPAEKIASTLVSGDIKMATLTSEQYAKLGAVLEYLTYHGMYSPNFAAQVDMHQFDKILNDYRNHNMTSDEKLQMEKFTKELIGSPDEQ